ncbi:MAG: hypothetical protein WC375_08810 [Methanomassiliicoccales archaeon]
MNSPVLTVRLPKEIEQLINQDVEDGKFKDRSAAARSIISKHYARRSSK